ncbi:MAG: protein TolR [Gammaproteobacteria bacterium]|nr:protein TolR [Gammaproteobacteria bacterium]MDH5594684.1 protein TolR [Gammaproteobacteria bacterium]MDH5613524.1 protein TolR [Gammaproteobacteria bacterium]
MARQRIRKHPMSEINVVPYIDVMLVLLVIFMITAPLLTEGVKVDLPQASSNAIEKKEQEPVIVTVDVNGNYYLSVSENPESPIDHQTLVIKVAAIVQHQPKTQVLVRGDENVNYGKVVTAMSLLQKAGVPGVGLVTRSPDEAR